jgi:hypothetical protein
MAMIDYSADLYDPVYGRLGVPATLTLTGTAGEVTITVIDDTRPKRQASGGGVEVSSVAPGAFARMPEIIANGIVPDEFEDAVLTFNGRSWIVRNHEMGGNPNGENFGQVRFLLSAIESSDG